jgi:hypothetical protein
MLERLSQRCAEAYQVVGSLAGLAELMGDPAVQKALDRGFLGKTERS